MGKRMARSQRQDEEADDKSYEKVRLQKILTSVGVPDELRKELVTKLMLWKADEDVKMASKPAARAPEPTRKEREAMYAADDPMPMAADVGGGAPATMAAAPTYGGGGPEAPPEAPPEDDEDD